MVDFTKIVERTLQGGGADDLAAPPRRRKSASRRVQPVKDGPLSRVFGEPEEQRKTAGPAPFSDRLGGLFGVDRESWEKRDGPR